MLLRFSKGAEASAPGHWHLQQGHVHHELICQRHLRADRQRELQAVHAQWPLDHFVARDPDGRALAAARRVGQARGVRGHQGCHQVHQLQIGSTSRRDLFPFVSAQPQPAFLKANQTIK